MSERFSLGIEEEFQIVDAQTGALRSAAPQILARGAELFGENIKPEMLQTTVELISDVLPDIAAARENLYTMRARLANCASEEGMALISAGTHPTSDWQDQLSSEGARYQELAEEYKDIVLSDQIFGLHVHVGVSNKELAIQILNQVRIWIPHLIALSSNSPFWVGRMTGLKSYRTVQWKRFPRSGIPFILSSWNDFEQYVHEMVSMGAIDNGKKVWWDVRPHAYFDTLEFRVCDMPLTIEDTLAIAALCQALIAKLTKLIERGKPFPVIRSELIEENKWWSLLKGLDAEIYDFEKQRHIGMRESLRELLDFVEEVVDDLGSQREMQHIASILDDPIGTGADKQIAIYRETGDPQKVIQFLREQTMLGIDGGVPIK